MTLEQLEQYAVLKREEALWTKELADIRNRCQTMVSDTVRGSSQEFPYTEHTITITGQSPVPDPRITRREQRLQKRKERTRYEREQIEQFIDTLDDSQLRQIVHYRYICGYQWTKVAILMHNKESTLKMRLNRYFKKS